MKRLSVILFGSVLAGTLAASGQAQQQAQAERPIVQETLKVGVSEIAPLVFLESQSPYGYEIDLWNQIADDLSLQTEWVAYESFARMMEDLSEGDLDGAIAGISITAEREAETFDFSYPSYRSGLQLMMRSPDNHPIRSFVGGLASWTIWRPLLLVMATSAAVGASIWLFEHKHNENFSDNPVRGVGQGIWFAIVTLGTFGYGDVTPVRLPGRIIACLWMGASFFIVADFIASMTVEQLAESNLSFEDIQGEVVGVIESTTAEAYVRAQPVEVARYENFRELTDALESGEVEAIIHDIPTLKYVANRNPEKFEIVGEPLTQEDYGIAFREGEEALVESVSQEILQLQERGYLRSLNEKWFGEDES